MPKIMIYSGDPKKMDYTKKVVEDDGGDIACPLREIAVASGRGSGVISAPHCTNNCICWSACPLFNGEPIESLFTTY